MEEGRRTGVLGLEGGRVWLPSHVFNVACKPAVLMEDSSVVNRRGTGAFLPTQHGHIKNTDRINLHRRSPEFPAGKRSSGSGPGMHAAFKDSRLPRSCGTGFFLPRCSRDYYMQRNKNNTNPPLNLKKHVVHPPITIIKEKEKDGRHYRSTTVTSAAATTKDRDDVEDLLPEEWSY